MSNKEAICRNFLCIGYNEEMSNHCDFLNHTESEECECQKKFLDQKFSQVTIHEKLSMAEMVQWLRENVSEDDLIISSRVLPKDHPIRPALKKAIRKKKGGG